MMLFYAPPPTRYDLQFTIFGIPVRVHPLFWVITVLFGVTGGSLLFLPLWVAVVFISILVHELGHALMMRFNGQSARVVLHAMGGLAIPDSVRWGSGWANVSLTPVQNILIALAGPGAGFLLAALVMIASAAVGGDIRVTPLFGVLPLVTARLPVGGEVANYVVNTLLWVNIVWGLINLVPVFPLDGGHVARHWLVSADPLDGARKALWVSVIAGGVMALAGAFLFRSLYMALLFGLLAFQSYQSLRGGVRDLY